MFSTVRGPRRAQRGDCQESWTGRDGKRRSFLVRETSGRRALQCKTNWRRGTCGTSGDCRAEFLLHSIISLARQKHEYVQNIIKEVLYDSNKWGGGLLVSAQYRIIARSGTYLRYMVDHKNNNEARNSTP